MTETTVVSSYRHDVDSPIGPLVLLADADGALTGLLYPGHRTITLAEGSVADPAPFRPVQGQLEEYFAGERTDFDLPMAPRGTPFQREAWAQLRLIPYGQTRTYGQIAASLGQPGAARAVGLANNRNPISIIVPCHRVIGSTGALTGYGGGIEAKKYLLDLESRGSTLF
ncbi:methylated-DNA--[protein]-cysteine S-methyltransferase [Occultella glacieicola]|uniref:Methylated-DNA--protein-cysteine methyltransferase n=1 Tax=Occultella glacieicola TaxID=2518684 RepID=A0ABY2E6N0_9MICO|nr:methylated-DNA--[protein]-cysteine S-methyltransferase [Occultella glacieicola]TDE97213.1 methylated-DNA--[protein]-cysteine S-methyltransferase [Occultella glacieicola]